MVCRVERSSSNADTLGTMDDLIDVPSTSTPQSEHVDPATPVAG